MFSASVAFDVKTSLAASSPPKNSVLYHAELAAALARLPEQTQEKIFRYYFLRQPQRVIGVHIGRTRSTAGRHIQLALQRLRRLMEENRYE